MALRSRCSRPGLLYARIEHRGALKESPKEIPRRQASHSLFHGKRAASNAHRPFIPTGYLSCVKRRLLA